VNRPRSGLLDFGLAALGAFCFGCTILFNRAVARDGVPPSVALGVRFGCAGLLLLAALAIMRRPLLPPVGERFAALALGLLLYAVESTLFYMGLERGTAAAVALIFYAYPAVIALVEVWLGAARLQPRTIAALLLAVSGGAVVAVGGGDVAITPVGILCVFGSIAAFSTYVLVSDRVLVRTDSLTAATWTAIGAAIGVTFAGFVQGVLEAPSGPALASMFANGVATAAAFTLFFVVLGRIGATRTAIVMAMEAVIGIALSAIFLDESVKPIVAVGGVAILAGAVLAALATPQPTEEKEATVSP
jgi:drug/metabolite transporter (DMT)-like permease